MKKNLFLSIFPCKRTSICMLGVGYVATVARVYSPLIRKCFLWFYYDGKTAICTMSWLENGVVAYSMARNKGLVGQWALWAAWAKTVGSKADTSFISTIFRPHVPNLYFIHTVFRAFYIIDLFRRTTILPSTK